MKLTGSYKINLEKQKVWDALNDPEILKQAIPCLLYTSPSPRDRSSSRMPSSA